MDANSTALAAIQAKTDNLPADPASESAVGALPTLAEMLAGGVALEATLANKLDASAYTAPNNAGIQRILGLVLENQVEDDIIRDAAGNKTSSVLYSYDSAASVGTHVSGGGPGLIAKYSVTAAYDANNRMTSFKVARSA